MPNAVAQKRKTTVAAETIAGRSAGSVTVRNTVRGRGAEGGGRLGRARVERLPGAADDADHHRDVEEHQAEHDRDRRPVEPERSRAVRPRRSSCRKATPTTTVGSTNGTSSAARTDPAQRQRRAVQDVRRRQPEQHREQRPGRGRAEREQHHPVRSGRGSAPRARPPGSSVVVRPEAERHHRGHRHHEERDQRQHRHQRPARRGPAGRRVSTAILSRSRGRATPRARRRGWPRSASGSSAYGSVGCSA